MPDIKVDRALLKRVLKKADNVSAVAARCKVSRTTMYRIINDSKYNPRDLASAYINKVLSKLPQ